MILINNTNIIENLCKDFSYKLEKCPFCGGLAHFSKNKSEQLIINHYPESGVNCPARFEQFCDSFEQGIKWWNTRV